MRKQTVPENSTLTYLLGDHLGSTSLAVDASTGEVVETRYKPWGEVRYSTPDKSLPTRYTFTGQYAYTDDPSTVETEGFGLMFYNARWYDTYTGRFAQADSIVPDGVQGYDRYAYVNNSPIMHTDPSGYCKDEDEYYCRHSADNAGNSGSRGGSSSGNGSSWLSWNGYKQGWTNAGQAWSIVTNPNASFGQRLGGSAYLTGWVGFGHVGPVIAGGMLAWEGGGVVFWKAAQSCIGSAVCRWITGAAGGAGAGNGRVVLSGHGEYDSVNGTVTIPEGTTLHTYAPLGKTITDKLGNAIETGVVNSGYDVFGPGTQAPNLTLLPPYNPDLIIKGNPITVGAPTLLSDLLEPNMGNVHWAACLVIKC